MSTGKLLIRMLLLAGGLWGVGAASPAALDAQAKVELIPFFASYYPLASVNEFPGSGSETITERQTAAPSLGGRFRYWVSNKVGLEAAGAYTTTGTRFTSDQATAGVGLSLAGEMVTASGRVLYRPARTNLHFIVGAGIVSRSGDTWDLQGLDETTDIAGVVGLGLRAAVTPKFSLDLSLEASLYSFDPDGDVVCDPVDNALCYQDSRFQSDIVVSIGIPIALAR